MEFRILGPLEVCWRDEVLPLGSTKQRALLAELLLSGDEVVSTDRIVEDLWGETPPESASHMVHVYVSRLRKSLLAGRAALSGELIVTRPPGYVLRLRGHDLDVERFERLATEGRKALADGDAMTASRILGEALSIWRGPPLADLSFEDFVQPAIARLEDARLAAIEDRIEADLALGRHAQLTGELRALLAQQPLRERLVGQLMLALYRCGRQAEALAVYREARTGLVDELGIDPSTELQQLESEILHQDPRLYLDSAEASTIVADRAPSAPGAAGDGIDGTLPAGGSAGVRRPRTRALAAIVLGAALLGGIANLSHATGDAPRSLPNSVALIDAASGTLKADIPVGRGPSALTASAEAAWVSNFDERTVSLLDVEARSEAGRFGDVGVPAAIAAEGEFLWVADTFSGTITKIGARSGGATMTIRSVRAPAGIAVGFGSVWVTDAVYGTVTRIDPSSGRVEATVQLPHGSGPTAIAAGSGGVWVADGLRNAVTRIDPSSDAVAVATIALCCHPSSISVGGGAVWVTSDQADRAMRIDPEANAVALSVRVDARPGAVVVAGGAVWVADAGADVLQRLDPSGAVRQTIALDASPTSLTAAGPLLLVALGPG